MCSQAAENSQAPAVKPSLHRQGSQQRPETHFPAQTRPQPPQFFG